jgi:hypothetical protein
MTGIKRPAKPGADRLLKVKQRRSLFDSTPPPSPPRGGLAALASGAMELCGSSIHAHASLSAPAMPFSRLSVDDRHQKPGNAGLSFIQHTPPDELPLGPVNTYFTLAFGVVRDGAQGAERAAVRVAQAVCNAANRPKYPEPAGLGRKEAIYGVTRLGNNRLLPALRAL